MPLMGEICSLDKASHSSCSQVNDEKSLTRKTLHSQKKASKAPKKLLELSSYFPFEMLYNFMLDVVDQDKNNEK